MTVHKKKASTIKQTAASGAPFYCIDGATIKSIKELAQAIDRMSDDTFYYHVTNFKNDFATWVSDVLKDTELAQKLGEKRTREQNLVVVLKYIAKI
jgi:hypothetical protein